MTVVTGRNISEYGLFDTIYEADKITDVINIIKSATDNDREFMKYCIEHGIETPSVLDYIIASVFKWIFIAFAEFCLYRFISLMIGSMASIVQHTKIAANLSLYNSSKNEPASDEVNEAEQSVDPAQSDAVSEEPSYSDILSDISISGKSNTWMCGECGARNTNNSLTCKTCGKYK